MEAIARDHELKALASVGREAVDHAIIAAQRYMTAVQETRSKKDRSRLQAKAKELLNLAERIKNYPDPPGPKSTRELTTGEKIIILRSSTIHDKKFPPWDAAELDKKDEDEVYVDPSEFTLSPTAQKLLAGWKRPLDILSGSLGEGNAENLVDDMMKASTDCDLVQDMVTDCSVVASLSAAMPHLCSKKGTLLASLMYPFDHDKLRPALSKSGKYVFRMHFNGYYRRVEIDDRLPASSSERTLFVVDRRNERLIWPALMEKAYLKVRGGYDFYGSNSGTDLYVLTGWIPEQIVLRCGDEAFDIDRTWSKMKRAFDMGTLVATLGTPDLPPEEESLLGLVSQHDYAVLDMKEELGSRLLLVKNPWRTSVVWKGSSSSAGSDNAQGKFWIAFEDVVNNFDNLYLNWDPNLFMYRQDHHFTWELPADKVAYALSHNPQYTVTTQDSSPVWVLLCRHWQGAELDMLRASHQHQSEPDISNATGRVPQPTLPQSPGFMALRSYLTSPPGTRVLLPDRLPVDHTPLFDSPHSLLRLEEPTPNVPYTVVVVQSDLPLPKYSLTLAFFSLSPLTVAPSPPPYQHSQSLSGSWTRRTAGGRADTPSYHANPSWSLTVPSRTRLSLLLTTSDHNLPIHVCLVYASSSPVPSRRDMLLSSGEYRRGATHVQSPSTQPLEPGVYIATVSTFTPGQLADFVLAVGSDVPLGITPAATPEAGRFRREAAPLRLGGPDEGASLVHRAPVTLTRLSRVSVQARTRPLGTGGGGGPSCALKVKLELGPVRGPYRTVLAAAPAGEGEFADTAAGGPLRTVEVDVDPVRAAEAGGLYVQVEGAGDGIPGVVDVEVLSDNAVSVGAWEAVRPVWYS